MFAALRVNEERIDLSNDEMETVELEFDTDNQATHQCCACGESLIETVNGYEDEFGEITCRYSKDDELKHHDPEPIPVSWCNRAAIYVDESQDSVTLAISVGDPRGAFTFTIRRVPEYDLSDLAGHLIMHTPYADEPSPHMALTRLSDGTHVVGSWTPSGHLRQSAFTA